MIQEVPRLMYRWHLICAKEYGTLIHCPAQSSALTVRRYGGFMLIYGVICVLFFPLEKEQSTCYAGLPLQKFSASTRHNGRELQ